MSFRAPARAALALLLALCLTFSPSVFALGPFEKQHPLVDQGMEAYGQGRYEDALHHFEEAKKELPNSAALEFNRGNALYKLGRLDEAKQAYENVQRMDQQELAADDHYNMGNTYARLGDKKEAIRSYRRALKLNPKDAQARHNLEVLLRDLKPPEQSADGGVGDGGQGDGGTPKQDGGTDGGQRPDGGNDGGQSGDAGSDGGADGGSDGGADGGQGDGGQRGDAGSDGGDDGGDGQGEGEGDKSDGGSDGGSQSNEADDGMDAGFDVLDGGISGMSKEEAEKLLDAMKQNEKNLQLWKFQQKKKKRKPDEKDW